MSGKMPNDGRMPMNMRTMAKQQPVLQPTGQMQPPAPPPPQQQQRAVHTNSQQHNVAQQHQRHPHPHPSSSLRLLSELKKYIDDFLTKIECALHTPYDVIHAQKDYETILFALSQIHKNLNDKDILNIGPSDKLVLDTKNKKDEAEKSKIHRKLQLFISNAHEQKAIIDSEFEKIAAAASAAAEKVRFAE